MKEERSNQVLLCKDIHTYTYWELSIQEDGGITFQQQQASKNSSEHTYYIGRGLVDLQVNGFAGVDFNALPLTEEDLSACDPSLNPRKELLPFYPPSSPILLSRSVCCWKIWMHFKYRVTPI